MYSSKKSFVTAMAILYFMMGFGTYWQTRQLEELITNVENDLNEMDIELNELEKEVNELEREVDALNDRCDNLGNYIAYLDQRVSTLEVSVSNYEQVKEEINEGEMEMLAQLIEAEAGNQDFIGKCLVADVVLNRVDSDKFPLKENKFSDTIDGIIHEHYIRESDGIDCYQFSTVKFGSFKKAGSNISADSYAAARQEMEGERIDDRILYFTAGYYNPCCIPAYVHGDHYFGY